MKAHCATALLFCVDREWEQSVLAAGAGGDKQARRVRSLFQRQLQVPLAGAEATLAAYAAWEQQQIAPDAKVAASFLLSQWLLHFYVSSKRLSSSIETSSSQ